MLPRALLLIPLIACTRSPDPASASGPPPFSVSAPAAAAAASASRALAAAAVASASLAPGLSAAPAPALSAACTTDARPLALADGIRIQRLKSPIPSPVGIGDGCITLVRIDLARHRLRLFNAAAQGQKNRTAEGWAKELGLTGVINASMYGQDGRSVGLMINGTTTNQAHDDKRHGGFLAFEPVHARNPAIAALGRECAGFDLAELRRDYRVVFQSYRLLDCDARPLRWKDPKVFSAAAIGVGKKGDVVFIHSRTPYTMTEFATVLALPALDLAQAMYVEGGPEASLYVSAGGTTIKAIGSYESAFRTNDDNNDFWEIPNVIGFSPL